MPWLFSDEVGPYVERAWDLLAADPVRHSLPLGVIETVRAGGRWSDLDMLFGWYDERGTVRGAVSMTPPYELLLAEVPADTVEELVAGLRGRAVALPGVNGAVGTVERFVQEWTTDTGSAATSAMRLRLYVLGTLRPAQPAAAGQARPAAERDLDTAVRWLREFQAEANLPAADPGAAARRQIRDRRLWLWEDPAGHPVALAARTAAAAGVARLGPVYTPPQHRGHGYGTAVTAACTADALRSRIDHVVLFTDLANPTSNSIYQRIGYRPVGDRHIVHFSG